MPKKKKKRKKHLGSGLLDDARKGINKRQAALEAAMEEPHEPGTRRHNARVDERDG